MRGVRQNMLCRRMIADKRGAFICVRFALHSIQCSRLARPCALTCVFNESHQLCDVPATVSPTQPR